MKHIREICQKFQIHPNKYRMIKNVTIVETETNDRLVIKKKFQEKTNLYQYLKSRGFHHFPNLLDHDDNYEIYPYIEDAMMPKEQKALDIIYLMSLLHNKTTFYREVDLNRVKQFYEEKLEAIEYFLQYYQDLQMMIERNVYMSPSEYLLIRNISFIYQVLYTSRNLLEEWYHLKESTKKERYALVHHNLILDHYRNYDQGCFISWDRASIDIPVYDFLNFYQKNSIDLDYISLLDIYESKYPLLREEELRLFLLLLIPRKLVFGSNEMNTTREINLELKRLRKIYDMVLKKYQKYSKEQKD